MLSFRTGSQTRFELIEAIGAQPDLEAFGDRLADLIHGKGRTGRVAAAARDIAAAIGGGCAIYGADPRTTTVRLIASAGSLAAGWPAGQLPATGRQRVLRLGDRTVGWLCLDTERPGAPVEAVAAIAGPLLAIAIDPLAAKADHHDQDAELLAEALQLFNDTRRPEPMLEFIVQRVTEMLDGDRGVLRLINEGRDRLDLGAIYARDPESLADLQAHVAWNIPLGERVAGRVAASGEPMIVTGPPPSDLSTTLLGTNSLISLPLRNNTEVIGTLTVGFAERQQFLPERLATARHLASLAALVLENSGQHAKSQRQAREAMALFEVARALTTTMSVQEILRQITARAAELLDVQYCMYCRFDPATGELIGEVVHGVPDDSDHTLRMPISPLAAEAVASRRAVFASDAQNDPRVNQVNVRRYGIKSVVCAPLLIKDRFLGVIYLYDKQRRRVFEPEEIDLITNFATYAVVAIENSNLHEGLQHTLDQLLVLYQAGRDISSSLELDSVVEAVTRSLAHLFSADHYAISELPEGNGQPCLLASRGSAPHYLTLRDQPAIVDQLRWVLESHPTTAAVVGPLSVPDPETGEPAGYLQIVPLRARGRVVAAIEIYAGTTHPTAENHDLLMAIGAAAGAAIEHAKLYAVVRDQQAQLESLIEALITAQEEERRRIAYDIHDGLAQIVVSADEYLQTYQELHRQGLPNAPAMLERGLHYLGRAIAESRRVISHLRPPGLDDFGLVPALEEFLGELRGETGWKIELIDRLRSQTLSPAVETTVYRIVQEALANARKYAAPDRIRVGLTVQDGQLLVEVRDWGRGFDPAQVNRAGRSGRRIGLVSMQERARLIGGSCHVQSAPQQGTRIRVTIPLATAGAGNRAERSVRPRETAIDGVRE